MKTYLDKDPENTRLTQSADQAEISTGGRSVFQFQDNRPSAVLQRKQVKALANKAVLQKNENKTGLPDNLKSGIENLSGYSMDDVKVHYNSDKPAQLQALAYTQDTDIHIAPGQEKHLPHEAWHVVQQKQGRVKPTRQMKGKVNINDDVGLEKEADILGQKAMKGARTEGDLTPLQAYSSSTGIVQRRLGFEFETGYTVKRNGVPLTKKTRVGSLSGQNWKVESDDNGRMEFIIYPPLEIDDALANNIQRVFSDIENVCKGLEEFAKKNRSAIKEEVQKNLNDDPQFQDDDSGSEIDDTDYIYNAFSLQAFTGLQDDHLFMIHPNSVEIAGNPQVTTGLTLDQLFNLKNFPIDDKSPARYAVQGAQGKIFEISVHIPDRLNQFGYNYAPSDKLKGLLIVIGHYLKGGNQLVAFDYPKELTDSFVLSRTNVSELFKRITHNERIYFKKYPQQFVDLGLFVANMAGTGETKLLTPGVKAKGIPTPFGPTRAAWLHGLTLGVDLLSRETSNDYESMGELGNKTEYVGGTSGNLFEAGGIFELRAGQSRGLEYTEWKQYAVDLAKFINSFQKDNHNLLRTLNKNK